jgi:hypothetical protein
MLQVYSSKPHTVLLAAIRGSILGDHLPNYLPLFMLFKKNSHYFTLAFIKGSLRSGPVGTNLEMGCWELFLL